MSITLQDIVVAIEKMSNAWKLLKSIEDLSDSLQLQLRGQLDTLVYSKEELESLQTQLKAAEEQKIKLMGEIEGLNQQIISLQKELESRPKPEPTPPVESKPPVESNKIIATIPFTIKDTTGQGRSVGEYSFTGIPLAEGLGVKDVNQLSVQLYSTDRNSGWDALGVIADIRPTAFWPNSNIQWVQVVFLVESFTGSSQYELLVYEKPQAAPLSQIHAWKDGFTVYVKNESQEYAVTVAGVHLESSINGSGIRAIFEDRVTASLTRDIYIEYLGPLVCYVVLEGVTTDLNFSTYIDKQGKPKPAPISFRRRYQFLVDNPLVICQETIRWEGSYNGSSYEKDQPEKPTGQRDLNAVLGTLWRERLSLESTVEEIQILHDESLDSWPIKLSMDQVRTVSLEQSLRPQRLNALKTAAYPLSSRVSINGQTVSPASGQKASGGILSVKTLDNQYVTVALKDMHLHEPQAIRLVGNEIQLDLASDKFWLPHHSGVEVTYAIHVDNSQPDLNHIWRQVNKPLRGLCQPEQYNESGGFNCLGGIMIPERNITTDLNVYDHYMQYTAHNTITKMQSFGFQGLMTWGLYPRYWAEWGFNSGEVGSGVGPWDELLRQSWTDYWCASKLALEWAIRSGEVQWIEELTIPAAVRMLHTQIMQAAPDDSWFYAGQAPAGYAMYRSDFNSSHQYWENLYLYYLITGDRTVIDIIERGALTMASWLQEKKLFTGRHPMQWIQCFLFLSRCHYDKEKRAFFDSYFSSVVEQAIRNHYLEGYYEGEREAIWTQQSTTLRLTPGFSGNYESHQLFSLCFYDMEMLYQFGLRTNNKFINGIQPFDAMINIARTIIRRGIGSESKNVETSAWLRIFNVDHNGADKFTRFEGGTVDNQKILFPDDKGTMCLFFSRCAWLSNDPEIKKVSRELVKLMFKQVAGRGLPFGKLIGMLMSRLSAAVTIEQMIDIETRPSMILRSVKKEVV